jgi:dUTPase
MARLVIVPTRHIPVELVPSAWDNNAAGLDIFCLDTFEVPARSSRQFQAGFKAFCETPEFTIFITDRVGVVNQSGIRIAGGMIDAALSDREIRFVVDNISDVPKVFNKGDRIAQIVLIKTAPVATMRLVVRETKDLVEVHTYRNAAHLQFDPLQMPMACYQFSPVKKNTGGYDVSDCPRYEDS